MPEVKVQVSEREIVQKVMNNLYEKCDFDEADTIIGASLAAHAVMLYRAGRETGFAENTGKGMPTTDDIIDDVVRRAKATAKVALTVADIMGEELGDDE